MKKLISLLLCCLFLCGCTAKPAEATLPIEIPEPTEIQIPTSEPTEPLETTQSLIPLNIYVPDENAELFETIPTVVEILDEHQIVQLLIEDGMLNEGIELNQMELVDTQLNLDFNQAFLDQLRTYGTTGERMMIGSVVNTFLDAYGAESVYITVNGNIMESGHVIYDFPMEFFE